MSTTESEATTTPAADAPSWWHRDHPTFTSLAGFFTGLIFVLVVPAVYAAILQATVSEKEAEGLFPFVLIALVVPITLLAVPRTHRFARYMFLGIGVTVLVVALTATIVLAIMVQLDK
ncbi:MAG: hypothetical protein ACR2K3_02040 [Nocardioides sp.]